MSDSVILIIDMQNDYCHPEGYYANRDGVDYDMNTIADKIVSIYDRCIELGKEVVCFSILYPPGDNPCVIGTWGSEYYRIHPKHHFYKNGFNCFDNIEFCNWMKSNRIKNVYICGFQTTFCVEATYKSALKMGYEVFLILDLLGERKKHIKKASIFLKEVIDCGRNRYSECLYDV